MTTNPHATGSRNSKLLMLGLLLAFIGTLLVTSFYYIDNHRWYWDIAPIIGVLIVIFAASGGLLIGHSLTGTQERRLWLVGLGGGMGLAWIASGTVAASLGFFGMNYLPEGYIGWDSYSSKYLVGFVDLSLLQFATATGLIGGFCLGLGVAPKAYVALTPLTTSLKK